MFSTLLFEASVCGANLITYEKWQARRGRVMAMDETGTAVTELYACDKGVPCGIDPSISPPATDGSAWIAFNGWDLYKIRENGTDLTRMLCNEGTDIDGQLYRLARQQEWSPDGMEILVQTMSYLALIDADFVAPPGCASMLKPIYSYDRWGVEPEDWHLEGTAAWNDDGSKIAFFEMHWGDTAPYNRLVILQRQGTGGWAAQDPIYPSPKLPNALLFGIDWQRGGSLLAFDARDDSGQRPTSWLMWVDIDSGDSGYLLNDGSPLEGYSPSWSPDGSQLIFEDAQDRLFKWSYVASTFPDGPVESMGSGKRPDWQRNPLRIACDASNPCNDGKECTTDTCVGGFCDFAPLNGGSCGEGGWCVEGDCFEPECSADTDCNDFNYCTADTCSGYECSYDAAAAAGLTCDDGDSCTEDDRCDGSGGCEGDIIIPTIPGCEPVDGLPGDPCTSGAECVSGLCHPKKHVCK